ncbi:DsbA family protein [Azoarcus sp. TTM-91]|nr:DsbA family protein [Azoarcus sp. TTM-91]
MMTLHYIFDPLCGWCYAAAPLVKAARSLPGLRVAFHGGGMMMDGDRRPITPQWREYVIPHDRRIAAVSGQPFGEAYFDGLLLDRGAVMDSAPPTTAILAAEAIAGRGLDMLDQLQRAHYVQGRRIAEPAVLHAIASELGLNPAEFDQAYADLEGAPTRNHVAASRELLARVGGRGFPTLVLETDDRKLQVLDLSAWLGKPDAFREHLAGRLPAATAEQAPAPFCGVDGCAPEA